MGVIVPDGDLRLLTVGFDASYSHQLTFASESAQATYFNSLAVYGFDADEYTFIQKDGTLRVNKNADELHGCNYIMYRNNVYSNTQWFYGFIENIKWLSDNSCAVSFITDVWQTWQFEIVLKNSFVLREHASIDTVGYNVEPENLEIGDYVPTNFIEAGLSDLCFVVALTIDGFTVGGEKIPAEGGMFTGIYSGASLWAYQNTATGVGYMNSRLEELVEKGYPESVIAIYMCPKWFLEIGEAPFMEQSNSYSAKTKTLSISKPSTISGYTPKNNKLFTYPYRMVYVHNNNGSACVYKTEDFSTASMDFVIRGIITPDPGFKIHPDTTAYNHFLASYDEALTLKSFAFCGWSYDSYKAWLAQNGSSQAISTLGSIVGGAGAVLAGAGAVGATIATGGAALPLVAGGIAAAGGVGAIFSALSKKEETKIQPVQSAGNALSGSVNCGAEQNDFYVGIKQIRNDVAQRIDKYFDMFGYATNQLKTPNIFSRTVYNYIKTAGLNATGQIPVMDMMRIKQMFNDGVTFWHSPSSLYNYSATNSIAT